jgi:hypothetical protein
MANVNRANGFRPDKSLFDGKWHTLVRKYEAANNRSSTNNSGDIYIGDVVSLSSGKAVPLTAVDGDALGVVVALGKAGSDTALNTENVARYYDPDNLSKRYLAYNEAGWVGVVPADGSLFSVQSAVADLTQGSIANISITGTAAHGNRTTGNSTQTITTGTGSGTCTVVEHVESPDNDTTAVNARYIVKFNSHINAIN